VWPALARESIDDGRLSHGAELCMNSRPASPWQPAPSGAARASAGLGAGRSSSRSASRRGLCELLRKGPVTPLFQGHRLAQLLDCVIGIRARKLFELLVGVPLSVHTELDCGGIPFRGGLLQCALRIVAGPDGGAHAIESEGV